MTVFETPGIGKGRNKHNTSTTTASRNGNYTSSTSNEEGVLEPMIFLEGIQILSRILITICLFCVVVMSYPRGPIKGTRGWSQ
uniref:Uncharacterized protein n=1 Tax=Panagrellus redivivus TaxID=6233 RepID=A0A7E4ZQ88_PANRE